MVRRGATVPTCARASLKDTPAAQRWLEEISWRAGVRCFTSPGDQRRRPLARLHQRHRRPALATAQAGPAADQIHGPACLAVDQTEHQKRCSTAAIPVMRSSAYGRALSPVAPELPQAGQHQQQSEERAARRSAAVSAKLNEFNPLPGEF